MKIILCPTHAYNWTITCRHRFSLIITLLSMFRQVKDKTCHPCKLWSSILWRPTFRFVGGTTTVMYWSLILTVTTPAIFTVSSFSDLRLFIAVRATRRHCSTTHNMTLSTVGKRAFSVSGATVWNDLSPHVISAPSLAIFRQRLKSFLFSQSYSRTFIPDSHSLLLYLQ